jgi:hypothetical protein
LSDLEQGRSAVKNHDRPFSPQDAAHFSARDENDQMKSLGIKFQVSNWQLEPLLAFKDDNGVGAN